MALAGIHLGFHCSIIKHSQAWNPFLSEIIYCIDQGVHISCRIHMSKIRKDVFSCRPQQSCAKVLIPNFNCSVLMGGRSKVLHGLEGMKEEHYHFLLVQRGKHLSKGEIWNSLTLGKFHQNWKNNSYFVLFLFLFLQITSYTVLTMRWGLSVCSKDAPLCLRVCCGTCGTTNYANSNTFCVVDVWMSIKTTGKWTDPSF